ncbi:alpha-1B adrenergic receptor-like isoform X2 [Nerophis ophidion]|uniref:alpha-1B adrenergic receptor-like isoform X2 n=1 Tax=Nerophis ophidion TaxID=159077 RepID=UPI002AE07B76|nr:alpha-1B adrenergic receptor-like isoform X2 [Nerophis ophidion]
MEVVITIHSAAKTILCRKTPLFASFALVLSFHPSAVKLPPAARAAAPRQHNSAPAGTAEDKLHPGGKTQQITFEVESIQELRYKRLCRVLDYWVFGRIFCDIWAAVDVLCCTASIMSLCAISIDRYIGVRYPLQYPVIVTEKRALLAMLAVWILAIVISIGPLLGWKQPPSQDDTVCVITEEPFYALFSSLGSFYIPLAVILAMYCRVYVVAKRTTKNLEAGVMKERQQDSNELTLRIHCRNQQIQDLCATSKGGGGASSAGRSTLTVKLLKFSREKKAAKTLGVVVGMFILCWLPFFLALPISSFNRNLRPPETFFKVIFWLGYFNSCLNPIIYPCYSREFKQAFIRILRCRWKRKRQGWQAYYNYRCQQGSNNSTSFLNGSQHTLSSVSHSPRCVAPKLRPPPWSSNAAHNLLPAGPASPTHRGSRARLECERQ